MLPGAPVPPVREDFHSFEFFLKGGDHEILGAFLHSRRGLCHLHDAPSSIWCCAINACQACKARLRSQHASIQSTLAIAMGSQSPISRVQTGGSQPWSSSSSTTVCMIHSQPTDASIAISPRQLYEKHSLSPGTNLIRVLDVRYDSSRPEDATSLTAQMTVIDLATSPRYTALSYAWGRPLNSHNIVCDSTTPIRVSGNCYAALVALAKAHQNLRTWVEAVCIDQDNDAEKARQIDLMGEIYSRAETVYIWMGRRDEKVTWAIQRMKEAAARWPQPPGCSFPFSQSRVGLTMEWLSYLASVLHFQHGWLAFTYLSSYTRVLDDIEAMLSTEWATRMWTFQEFMLASHPVFVYGHVALDWATFQKGLSSWDDAFVRGIKDFPYLAGVLWSLFRPQVTRLPMTSTGRHRGQDLRLWLDMTSSWRAMRRPTTWNGVPVRCLPAALKRKDTYSFREYERAFGHRRLVYRALLAVQMLLIMAILAPLVLILRTQLQGDQDGYLNFVIFLICLAIAVLTLIWIVFLNQLFRDIQFSWDDEQRHGQESMIRSVLFALRERKVGFAPDRINALIGVLKQLGVPTVAVSPTTTADAKQSGDTSHLLTLQVGHLLKAYPLGVGLVMDADGSVPGAPTWVPDWSTASDRAWWSTADVFSDDTPFQYLSYGPSHVFPDWRHMKRDWLFNVTETELIVGGVSLGRLSFTTESIATWQKHLDSNASSEDHFAFVFSTVKVFRSWFAVIGSMKHSQAVYNAVFMHKTRKTSKDRSNQWGKWLEWFAIVGPNTPRPLESIVQRIMDTPELYGYHMWLCNDVLGGKRVLFCAEDGYIGSGSPGMRKGDYLAQLHGFSMPMVLRRAPNPESTSTEVDGKAEDGSLSHEARWQVVGPACVASGRFKDPREERPIVLV
jgi:hypothetical protein